MTGKEYRTATKLVRGGLNRSAHQETSEALYLTSGFVYDSAEEAAAAFRDEADFFVYSRYGNPTVKMFEDRLALLEGAQACRATGSGMAAVFGALSCQLEAGDRVVASRALFGAKAFTTTNNFMAPKTITGQNKKTYAGLAKRTFFAKRTWSFN